MADLRSNNLLSEDVDIAELADITQNFTGAAIESLIRSSRIYSLLRMTKGGDSNVNTADFLLAMASDVASVPRSCQDSIRSFISRDILSWSPPSTSAVSKYYRCPKDGDTENNFLLVKIARADIDLLIHEENLSEEEIEDWVRASVLNTHFGAAPITLTRADITETRNKNI